MLTYMQIYIYCMWQTENFFPLQNELAELRHGNLGKLNIFTYNIDF